MPDTFTREPAKNPKPTIARNTYEICVYTECRCCGYCSYCSLCCYTGAVVVVVVAAAAAACFWCSSSYICHPRLFFIQKTIFFINEMLSTHLGSAFAFVRPRLLSIKHAMPLMAITGIRGSVGGRQPAVAKPPLYWGHYFWISDKCNMRRDCELFLTRSSVYCLLT